MKELQYYIDWMNRWSFTRIGFRYSSFRSIVKSDYYLGDEIKELKNTKFKIIPQLVVLTDDTTTWEIKPKTIIYSVRDARTTYKVKLFKGKITTFKNDKKVILDGTKTDHLALTNMVAHLERELHLIHDMTIVN